MKVAIIGSRNVVVNNLEDYIPENVTEIISGGAKPSLLILIIRFN